jgi:tRNA dimethylallyltransferase
MLFGPTAVGKTELIKTLFRKDAEIINADSLQVYRDLTIGTAKPEKELLDQVPHHLIDIKDPKESYDTGEFVGRADALIPGILRRKNLPVISGGTAFYLKNFLYGVSRAPRADETARIKIRKRLAEEGAPALYRELRKIDPESAEKISENDIYRLTRALEVYESSGKPLSFFAVPDQPRKKYRFLLIGLYRPRAELYRRIDARVETMFAEGLTGEIKGLLSAGVSWGDQAMKGIGYREFSLLPGAGCYLIRDIKELIKRNSRRFAKRQLTFFRKFPDVCWHHPDNVQSIKDDLYAFLGSP